MYLSNEFFKELPKADLHVHLNGSVPTTVVKKLLNEHKITLPDTFSLANDLQILLPVSSLREYFKPWIAFKKIPIGLKCLWEMVSAAIANMAMDNIKYVEFRNSPFYIGEINSISIKETLNWLIFCIRENSKIHGVDARLILSLTRHELDLEEAWKLLRAIDEVNLEGIIVGLDLSGDEDFPIPLDEVAFFFAHAKEVSNLGITIHAGETGNISNVIWAVNECKADRIGHGLAATNSEEILDTLKYNNICVEISLTSNMRTGYCKRFEDHPINKFIQFDIPFVLCTDNPAVHNVTLSEEYHFFYEQYGSEKIIQNMYNTQKKFAFERKLR